MNTIRRHLQVAYRRIRKNPGFTAIALLSLALGIGANTAIFSIVNSILIRPTPFAEPESLVEIFVQQDDFPTSPFSYPDLEDVTRETSEVFSGVAGSGYTLLQEEAGDQVGMLPGELVTANYFSLLGIEPALGRTFTEEDARDERRVVVLDHLYWERAYGADADLVGRPVRFNGQEFTVIGIAPKSYPGNLRGLRPALYVPIVLDQLLMGSENDRLESRGSHWIFTKARLLPGVPLTRAQGVLDAIAADLGSRHESWDGTNGLLAMRTTDVIVNPVFDRFIVPAAGLLLAVVGAVLLIACANLASFLLARATDRRKEVAIHLALGASRRSLIAALLTETSLLSLAGGLLGVGLAVGLLGWLVRADLPLPLPLTFDFSLDARVLLFSLGVSLLAGLLFGLAPALQSSNPDVASTLKDESTGGGKPRLFTLRRVLVTAQVATSTLLLVTAGLFLRSVMASQSVDPGFGHEPTGILTILLPMNELNEEERALRVQQLRERFETLPGVETVGSISNLHLNLLNTQSVGINIDGVEPPEGYESHRIDYASIDPPFFRAAGIPLLEGREFTERDDAQAPAVAIVSQSFADRFFPEGRAVGKTLRRTAADGVSDAEIVGIVADTKVRSLSEAPRPFVYWPFLQESVDSFTFLAQTSGSARSTSISMLQAGREIDPDLRVFESKTMERHLASLLFPMQASAFFVAVFAGLALALACIGLYGVVSYSVAQRSREVGIRVSLGADSQSVIGMLMRGGLTLVAVGGAIGLLLAVAVRKILGGLLFGVGSYDILAFVAVPIVLGAVGVLATYLPARRASRINPVQALRSQ